MTTIGRRSAPPAPGSGGAGAVPRRADHQDPSAGRPPLPARGTGDHRGTAARFAGVRAADGQAAHRAGRARPSSYPARAAPGRQGVLQQEDPCSPAATRNHRDYPRAGRARSPTASNGAAKAAGHLPSIAVAYKDRNTTERAFSKLKAFRAVAMRTDKRDYVYRGTVDIATIKIWLRDPVRKDP